MLYFVVFLLFSINYHAHAKAIEYMDKCAPSSSLRALQKAGRSNPALNFKLVFKELESCPWIATPPSGARNDDDEVAFIDTTFQTILAELQPNNSNDDARFSNQNKEELYIFVSFSMGEKALLNITHDAKQFGAILVLKGFHQGSYVKTAQALQNMIIKTGQGVLIDPELYTLFNITAVPTFVLAKPFPLQSQERIQTPIHDKLQGHVSTHYALETFVKEGDLKDEAQALLSRGALK